MSITDKLQTLKNTKQAIKQALIDKGVEVSDSDNFASYAEKITEITTGSSDETIAGMSISDIFSVDENGVLNKAKKTNLVCTANVIGDDALRCIFDGEHQYTHFNNSYLTSVSFPNLTTIDSCGLKETFNYCKNLTSISFPNLTSIGSSGMYRTFFSCQKLTSISFPKLTSIGSCGMQSTFIFCDSLKTINFPNLTTIGNYGMSSVFSSNFLTSVNFPNLTTIDSCGMRETFSSCINLTSLDLPSLSGSIYGNTFYGNYNLRKIWIPKEVTTIRSSYDASEGSISFSYSPFYNCSSDLVIYTDAPERLEGWSDYCFHIDSTNEATVIYGATHEDFENDNTNPSDSSSGGNGGYDSGGNTDPQPNRN